MPVRFSPWAHYRSEASTEAHLPPPPLQTTRRVFCVWTAEDVQAGTGRCPDVTMTSIARRFRRHNRFCALFLNCGRRFIYDTIPIICFDAISPLWTFFISAFNNTLPCHLMGLWKYFWLSEIRGERKKDQPACCKNKIRCYPETEKEPGEFFFCKE